MSVALLEDRSALVTGGTRGIGAAVARRLAAAGAKVTVTGRDPAGAAASGLRYVGVDFSQEGACEAFAGSLDAYDILVNNAGINVISPFEQIDAADFDRIHRVNVRAPMLLCRAALPSMRRAGWGRIVNIASIFGVVGKERRGSYSASKFALDGLTAALAAEVAPDGILANCVSPGFVDTDLTRSVLGEKGIAEIAGRIPIGRLATPDEIAELVAWLAGPQNTYVSGQNVVIDGGFTRV